jgi:hypothetical protein
MHEHRTLQKIEKDGCLCMGGELNPGISLANYVIFVRSSPMFSCFGLNWEYMSSNPVGFININAVKKKVVYELEPCHATTLLWRWLPRCGQTRNFMIWNFCPDCVPNLLPRILLSGFLIWADSLITKMLWPRGKAGKKSYYCSGATSFSTTPRTLEIPYSGIFTPLGRAVSATQNTPSLCSGTPWL